MRSGKLKTDASRGQTELMPGRILPCSLFPVPYPYPSK